MTDLTNEQRLERARQAEHAMTFLAPAFDVVISAYVERMEQVASTTPWEANKITALANATRIAREVQSQIVAIVHDGADAQANIKRAETIEKLTPAKRRLLNIGAF